MSVPVIGRATEFCWKGLTEKNNSFNLFFSSFVLVVFGVGRYRSPAGRLDTLHVLSERRRVENSIEKAIEGPSSYSYI